MGDLSLHKERASFHQTIDLHSRRWLVGADQRALSVAANQLVRSSTEKRQLPWHRACHRTGTTTSSLASTFELGGLRISLRGFGVVLSFRGSWGWGCVRQCGLVLARDGPTAWAIVKFILEALIDL